jgi:hypothetical protein
MQTPASPLHTLRGRYRIPALAFLLLFGSVSLASLWQGYTATPVNLMYIHDDAHVLNQDRVVRAADGVGYNIDLYTFDGNAGDLTALLRARVSTQQVGTVVIAIDTRHKRLAIRDNGSIPDHPVSFNRSQYQAAQRAFQATVATHDFTAATVAVLQELSKAASANRIQTSLPWLGAMLLVLGLVGTLLVLLVIPKGAVRSAGACESDLRSTPLG